MSVFKLILPLLVLSFMTALSHAQSYRPDPASSKYYLQCAARMANIYDRNSYKSENGRIGIFQFDVYTAQKAGLCKKPVPRMRSMQIWKFCDFQGPIAEKYDIRNPYDLRYDLKAKAAQFEMMQNLSHLYDDYIYQKGYDRLFGRSFEGVVMTPEIMRSILHTHGTASLDFYLKGGTAKNRTGQSVYNATVCMQQCIARQGKEWFCN